MSFLKGISLSILWPVVRLHRPVSASENSDQVLRIECLQSSKQQTGAVCLHPPVAALCWSVASRCFSPAEDIPLEGITEEASIRKHLFPYGVTPLLGSVPTEKPFSLKNERWKLWKADSSYLQITDTSTLRGWGQYTVTWDWQRDPAWLTGEWLPSVSAPSLLQAGQHRGAPLRRPNQQAGWGLWHADTQITFFLKMERHITNQVSGQRHHPSKWCFPIERMSGKAPDGRLDSLGSRPALPLTGMWPRKAHFTSP